MHTVDAIVVGGGPAGSTCVSKLRDAGLDVMVLDRAAFPRAKLCAGWVTPEVLADLNLDPQNYPLSFMTFDELHLHWKALTVKLKSRQHSIRRFEFDDFLLRRAGARVLQHKVREIRRDGGDYVIDREFRCKYLVGAGSLPIGFVLYYYLQQLHIWAFSILLYSKDTHQNIPMTVNQYRHRSIFLSEIGEYGVGVHLFPDQSHTF